MVATENHAGEKFDLRLMDVTAVTEEIVELVREQPGGAHVHFAIVKDGETMNMGSTD